jgi:hypothetical protein
VCQLTAKQHAGACQAVLLKTVLLVQVLAAGV